MIRTPRVLNVKSNADISSVLRDINKALTDVHADMSNGSSTHQVFTSVPTVDDIDNGQFVLYNDGVDMWIYTKRGDQLHKAQLTLVT